MSSFDSKKTLKIILIRIDHNSHHDQNILCTKDGKCKTTKGVPGCFGYHETYWWNSEWCPCQGLCGLRKMDQWLMPQQSFMTLLKGNKIT